LTAANNARKPATTPSIILIGITADWLAGQIMKGGGFGLMLP